MAGGPDKRALHRALVRGILEGDGKASPELRRSAFDKGAVPAAVRTLVDKVATAPVRITDEDFDAARGAGVGEDEIFEIVICAAVGEATRRYEGALAALDGALKPQDGGDAP